jgi:ABC-2 type transport system ATP-binding protein
MPDVVVAEQLTKWYGRRRAVAGVSFTVAAGEVLGLLGPNGSGKTTILRILSGYLRPSVGTATVAGVDVVARPLEARRCVGYVPEDVPLYEWMRVRELLGFMARIKGLSGAAVPAAVDGVMERLALGDVSRVPIGKLSRGFRQRVGIAQALLADPPVLVLDEPTNGLDPRQIIELRGLVRSLADTRTLVVASHMLAEIEKVADRVAILLDGRLLAVRALGSDASGRRVRMRVQGDPEAVRACLARVGGVREITVHGRDPAVFTVDVESASVIQGLVAAVIAERFALLELGAAVDLEAFFLDLTTGAAAGTA